MCSNGPPGTCVARVPAPSGENPTGLPGDLGGAGAGSKTAGGGGEAQAAAGVTAGHGHGRGDAAVAVAPVAGGVTSKCVRGAHNNNNNNNNDRILSVTYITSTHI